MASSRRREKEVVAVAFNQKEQRILEKSLATIRLEASYSLKLLDLHNRTVKVHFRQMKDKVSRIKSHLEPDEIHELRQLEAEGKLQPMYPAVSLGSALKIAAAARRFNSSHHSSSTRPLRAKSALPRVTLPDQGQTTNSGLAPPPPGTLKRSNSVTGVFIDMPTPPAGGRPGSAGLPVGGASRPSTALSNRDVPKGEAVGHREGSVSTKATETTTPSGNKRCTGSGAGRPESRDPRPSSSHLHIQQNVASSSLSSMDLQYSKGLAFPAQKKLPADFKESKRSNVIISGHEHGNGARSRKPSTATSYSRANTSHSHAPFSSHVATEKESRGRQENAKEVDGGSVTTPRSLHTSTERHTTSFHGLQDDLVDDLGEDLFAERRAELLEEEQYRAAIITRRKNKFLKDIDQYLRDNPPLTTMTRPVSLKTKGQEDRGQDGPNAFSSTLFRRRRVEFNTNPTHLPEEDYRERLMELWQDMNKCRYLRVPDDRIDLSGINTLASDTMKLFQVLKQREVEPLSNAWAE